MGDIIGDCIIGGCIIGCCTGGNIMGLAAGGGGGGGITITGGGCTTGGTIAFTVIERDRDGIIGVCIG